MSQITLTDGRVLAYEEYGDPQGHPVFYFHGWPSSRLGARKLGPAAAACHVRLISPDRPGYGLSNYQRHRRLLDWPDDLVQLADTLKISRFSVVGVSGGGPYAAVCGYAIPNRLHRLGIVVGLAPTNLPEIFSGIAWLNRLSWRLLISSHFFAFLGALGNLIKIRYLPALDIVGWGGQYDQVNVRKLNAEFHETMLEAFRQGVGGPYRDLVIYSHDWGFAVSAIKTPTDLWYGDQDKNVSLNMGKYYASQISGSKLTVYPDEGHTLYLRHAEDIFSGLTKKV